MCVGPELVAAMVSLRDAAEDNPAVHNANTPVDAELFRYFHTLLVDARIHALRDLARRIAQAPPPAFLCLDLLVEAATDTILLCETGLKFEEKSYRQHLVPITRELPESLQSLFTDSFCRHSARAFLRHCATLDQL